MNTQLLVVYPDGGIDRIGNTYESIRAAIGGLIDVVRFKEELAVYVHDEGLFERLPLNVPMSFITGAALWGPCVVMHGEPDDEGDNLPIQDEGLEHFIVASAQQWRRVVVHARANGQSTEVHPDPSNVPPPTVVGFESFEDLQKALRGEG